MATEQRRPKGPQPAARGRQAPQKRSFPLIPAIIGGAIGLIGLILLILWLNGSFTQAAGLTGAVAEKSPGGPVPTMTSRDHVDGRVEYSTNPPTSGNHAAAAPTNGFYPSAPPPDERIVHSLEHGNVVMYWNPDKLDQASFDKLKALYEDLKRSRARSCIILAQRQNMDAPIALTAWGALATLDQFDEAAIRAFWRDYVAKGPELGMGQCG